MFLTDLWFVLPDWAFNLVLKLARADRDAVHDLLCEIWSCRCEVVDAEAA